MLCNNVYIERLFENLVKLWIEFFFSGLFNVHRLISMEGNLDCEILHLIYEI